MLRIGCTKILLNNVTLDLNSMIKPDKNPKNWRYKTLPGDAYT